VSLRKEQKLLVLHEWHVAFTCCHSLRHSVIWGSGGIINTFCEVSYNNYWCLGEDIMINGRVICLAFHKRLASVVRLLVVIKRGIANPSAFLFVLRAVVIKGLKSLVVRI